VGPGAATAQEPNAEAAAAVVKDIEHRAKTMQSSEEIAKVGTISANGE
jgi:hypothetical protein